jgi:DNA-binding IclR family transcriptional regulator
MSRRYGQTDAPVRVAKHPTPSGLNPASLRSGTQSLERAISLIRELASRRDGGWRLGDLAARCDIDKGSAHRLLACLVRERLVEQRAGDRHYLLGPLIWELGLSVPGHPEPYGSCKTRLAVLAGRFAGLAFLMLRSGTEYVCAVRAGSAELRAVYDDVGTRRPLISSAGGVSILLALSEAEAAEIRVHNMQQEKTRCGDARLNSLDRMYRRSQEFGFGVNLGDVVPGIHAVGVPVLNQAGEPIASLCLMSWADNLPEARIHETYDALRKEASAAAADCSRASQV